MQHHGLLLLDIVIIIAIECTKKQESNHQDVKNVDVLRDTCFFKMPSASPARSTSVEHVESVPGTDGCLVRHLPDVVAVNVDVIIPCNGIPSGIHVDCIEQCIVDKRLECRKLLDIRFNGKLPLLPILKSNVKDVSALRNYTGDSWNSIHMQYSYSKGGIFSKL
jgi:hypothetical protein